MRKSYYDHFFSHKSSPCKELPKNIEEQIQNLQNIQRKKSVQLESMIDNKVQMKLREYDINEEKNKVKKKLESEEMKKFNMEQFLNKVKEKQMISNKEKQEMRDAFNREKQMHEESLRLENQLKREKHLRNKEQLLM